MSDPGPTAAPVLSERIGQVGVLTLNRPEALNAFTDDMREALLRELTALAADGDVRCIVLTGAGRAFCAGGDIGNMAQLQEADDTSVVERRMRIGGQVIRTLRSARQPTVAAINGPAAGAGMNLALGCDLRVGSDRMLFSESFVKIGLLPDWAGLHLLPRLVGTARAMELMMTGDRIDAATALQLGLLNRVHPHQSFASEWLAFATRLAAGPPATLAWIKRGIHLGATASLDDTLALELEGQKELFLGEDAREGMRAFLDKRPPEFGSGAAADR
jgi:2-(1,2-epoxy-1,2-dihydrophenyl)acetyl-CoA isomerase